MGTTIARQITSVIKWLLDDAGLDHGGLHVTTKAKDGHYESVVIGCNPHKAEKAPAATA